MGHPKWLGLATLLLIIPCSFAAQVDYEAPHISIVAVNEPLESVLRTVGEEMQISVRLPLGLNPTINCDVENKPVQEAFKVLLRDLSYSMQWEEGGDRLTGLVIMANGSLFPDNSRKTAFSATPAGSVYDSRVEENTTGGARSGSGSHSEPALLGPSGLPDRDAQMAERQERHREKRERQEAQFQQERSEREALHRAERLEDEARTREEDVADIARERALYSDGGP